MSIPKQFPEQKEKELPMVKSDLQNLFVLLKQFIKFFPENDGLNTSSLMDSIQQKIAFVPYDKKMAKRTGVQLKGEIKKEK